MRRAAKIDGNQTAIVEYLRGLGASVAITSMVGKGYPDLTVGYRGINYLIEVKDGSQPASRRKLTPEEQAWHAAWNGKVYIVESLNDVMRILQD